MAFINPGHFLGASLWFSSLQGWGGVRSTGVWWLAPWGTVTYKSATQSEPFFSLAGPGDLCTQKTTSPSHTPWRRRERAAGRGLHTDPRTDTCTQSAPLVETQTATKEPQSHCTSFDPPAAPKAVWLAVWAPSGFHPILGTHTEISTTNIQQLNTIMDTQCTVQQVFVLHTCFQMK